MSRHTCRYCNKNTIFPQSYTTTDIVTYKGKFAFDELKVNYFCDYTCLRSFLRKNDTVVEIDFIDYIRNVKKKLYGRSFIF